MRRIQLMLMGAWFVGCAFAQTAQEEILPMEKAYKRTYQIKKVSGQRPTIDGRLDEDFWKQGTWTEDFVQVQPYERQASPSPTRA